MKQIVFHEIEDKHHGSRRIDAPDRDICLAVAEVHLDIVIEEILGVLPLQPSPGPTRDRVGDTRLHA